jgi:hypothetical protein
MKTRKKLSLVITLIALVAFSLNTRAAFNYSSTIGSSINFDGLGNFTLSPAVNNLKITSGSAAGLMGEMSGTFTIGAITPVGLDSMAPITGTGTLVIHDGANDLTATLVWLDIYQSGTGGFLNNEGSVNLTAISYSGSNPDLLALKNGGSGFNVFSFQFIPAVTLAEMKSTAQMTSFSGTIGALIPQCTGEIGDFVWNDDGNGCQDAGEPGIPGVKVELYGGCGVNKGATPIATTTTDANGLYLFTGLCAGDYTVSFTTPSGFVHTVANQGCGGTPGDVHNPKDSNCQCTGADNCDVCVTLAADNAQDLTVDCGYIGATPCLNFTKTADTNSAPAGGQMGYTYALNNCGGTTYSNLAIVDDAGTPGFPGDDFTVGSGITLFPGQGTNIHVVVNLPIVECVSNSNPSITAGLLITQVLPNGNVKVDYRQSRGLNDNVYGTPAPADGWAHHNFSDLTGSDKAEFRFTDGTGKTVLDFYSDYISAASSSVTPMGTISYPSGYGSLGPNGGDGSMVLGSKSNVLWWSSTLTSNLNSGLNGGFPSPYLLNSPTPEASFPNWDYVDGYSVIVSSNAFGAAGFGGVTIPFVHNSPAKTGNNQVSPVPCSGCVTNIANVVTVDSAGGIVATIATDDAVVCLGNPAPPPSNCLITKGAFKIDKNTIQIPLKNAGTANIVLTEVDLAWNQGVNGRLTKVSLNGDFWTGPATGSPVALTSGFNSDANRRTIAKGQTKTLILTFEHPASKVLSDYTGGTVDFGTCVVTFP